MSVAEPSRSINKAMPAVVVAILVVNLGKEFEGDHQLPVNIALCCLNWTSRKLQDVDENGVKL